MYTIMKDRTKIEMTGRNSEPIDLDQMDYIPFPDGTKLPVPET